MKIDSYKLRRTFLAAAILGTVSGLGQAPADPLAKARSLLDAGKIEESESFLRDYIANNPSGADAHFLLGYALFRGQKPTESLAEFTVGAKFRRPRADELKIVAGDYVLLSDFSDADKWFSQVVSETPNDADAWYLLGRTKYNENEFAAAISSFEHALTLHPRYVEAENNIGLCWKELNNHDKARAAFETAIDWQGEKPVDAQPFLNLGTLLADNNQGADAVPYLTRAVAMSPKNPAIHEELGKVYLGMNKLPEAQAELEQAVTLAPDTSALHYKLAQILRKEGLEDRAQQEFAICEKLSGAHSSSKTPNPPPSNKPNPR
ncbi:MAG TPA: tetratricopeptide repeat protein [Terracidiphilus sp.]